MTTNKKMSSFRFEEKDKERWTKKAEKLKMTLTDYIAKKVNSRKLDNEIFADEIRRIKNTDPHSFI